MSNQSPALFNQQTFFKEIKKFKSESNSYKHTEVARLVKASIPQHAKKDATEIELINQPSSQTEADATEIYAYLLKNLYRVEQEFKTTFYALLEKPKDREKYWYYCYYYALQLQYFYECYENNSKLAEISGFVSIIEKILNNEKNPIPDTNEEKKSIYDRISEMICTGFKNMVDTPWHTSKIRDNLESINLMRMMYLVARLTWINLIFVLNDTNLIKRFNDLFHQHLDLQTLQKHLNTIQPVTNFISVAFYVTRNIINMAILIKHTFFYKRIKTETKEKSEEELNKELLATEKKRPTTKKGPTTWDRFSFEVDARLGAFLNDTPWAPVNLFTNYPMILGLGMPAIIGITSVFLIYDFVSLLFHIYRQENKFQESNTELLNRIGVLNRKDKNSLTLEEAEDLKVNQSKRRFLEIDHKETYIYRMQICCAAAVLLATGFTLAFMVTTPLASSALLFGCAAVAVSFYSSSGSYAQMHRKRALLEKMQEAGASSDSIEEARMDYKDAKQNFALNVVKYALLPALFIGAMAVSWQTLLLVTLAYGAYELSKSLTEKQGKSELEMIADKEAFKSGVMCVAL